jgi:hypothetical protein
MDMLPLPMQKRLKLQALQQAFILVGGEVFYGHENRQANWIA